MAPVFARTLEGIDGGASGGITPDPSPGSYQVTDYLDIDDAAVSITSDLMVTGPAILGNIWIYPNSSTTAAGTQVNRLTIVNKTVPILSIKVSGIKIKREVPGSIILAFGGTYKVNASDSVGFENTLPYTGNTQVSVYGQNGNSYYVKSSTELELPKGLTINSNHPNGRYYGATDLIPLLTHSEYTYSGANTTIITAVTQGVESITDIALNVTQIILTDSDGEVIASEDVNL